MEQLTHSVPRRRPESRTTLLSGPIALAVLACHMPVQAQEQQLRQQQESEQISTFDFKTLVNEVRSASLSLQRSENVRQSAQANEEAARLQAWPSLQVSNTLSAQRSTGLKQQHTLSVTASVWDFGRNSAQELRAVAQRQSADAAAREVEELIRVRVARFYVAVCSADAILQIATEQHRNAESKLKTVLAGYQRGERSQADVIKLRTELGKSELLRKKSQDESEALRTQLSLMLPQNGPGRAGSRFDFRPLPSHATERWSAFMARVMQVPVEAAALERLQASKLALEAELASLKADNFPNITAGGGVQASGTLSPLKADAFANINLNYSLPVRSVRSEKILAVLARVRESTLAREEELKARSDKLQQSKQRIDGLVQQLEMQKLQIKLLLEYQQLMRTRYFAGRASLLELTNTEDELLANRLELTRMQANVFVSAIDASEAVGGRYLEELLF